MQFQVYGNPKFPKSKLNLFKTKFLEKTQNIMEFMLW